jgi:error-prone DNA polymerase
MAAVISNGGGYYSTFGYLSEARRMGLSILPPHINLSEIKYTGKSREIRMGLMQIKDLTHEAKEAIIRERSKNGLFASFEEFLNRIGSRLHLQDVRVLIKAGCFDPVAGTEARPVLMWQALAFYSEKHAPAQEEMFKESPLQRPGTQALCSQTLCPPKGYSAQILVTHEIETLGFPLSFHPLDRYSHTLKGLVCVRAQDLRHWVGKEVTIIGWQITAKTVYTKDGEAMRFTSFEDQTGIYEAVLFPGVYHRYCHMLKADRGYILKGQVEETFGAISLTVKWIGFLDQYGKKSTRVKNPVLLHGASSVEKAI